MSKFVQIEDFKGKYKIPKDKFTKIDLQEYIDKYEVLYLQNLLGCEMYEEFNTDFVIPSGPTQPKFIVIWEPFCKDNNVVGLDYWNGFSFSCPKQVISAGMKEMLLGFIYWEYVKDNNVKLNIGGVYSNDQDNGTAVGLNASRIYDNYNESIKNYSSIQWYICNSPDGYDYNNYNGIKKEIAIL